MNLQLAYSGLISLLDFPEVLSSSFPWRYERTEDVRDLGYSTRQTLLSVKAHEY